MIFGFSSIENLNPKIDIPNIDKFFHLIEYFILGYLMARALINSFGNTKFLYIFIISVIISSFYGATDEFHQRFVPGRSCDVFDWVSDTFGSAVGAALLIYKERTRRAIDKTV